MVSLFNVHDPKVFFFIIKKKKPNLSLKCAKGVIKFYFYRKVPDFSIHVSEFDLYD